MDDYNKVIFCNFVWEVLKNEPDKDIVLEFINKIDDLNKFYNESGGQYPTIEYVMGLARDEVNNRRKEVQEVQEVNEEESENPKTAKDLRLARLKFYRKEKRKKNNSNN